MPRRARAAARPPAGASGAEERDLRDAILQATAGLLAQRRFEELSVADILAAAGASRGSFYFYFESKQAVLAELVSRAIRQGQASVEPWLDQAGHGGSAAATRGTVGAVARAWREQAPVLRAAAESWGSDPRLADLWRRQLDGFAAVAAARIDEDRAAGRISHQAIDSRTLASALVWLGERLCSLAAAGTAPFDDEDALVDVLTHVWMTALYQEAPQ